MFLDLWLEKLLILNLFCSWWWSWIYPVSCYYFFGHILRRMWALRQFCPAYCEDNSCSGLINGAKGWCDFKCMKTQPQLPPGGSLMIVYEHTPWKAVGSILSGRYTIWFPYSRIRPLLNRLYLFVGPPFLRAELLSIVFWEVGSNTWTVSKLLFHIWGSHTDRLCVLNEFL